MIIGCVRTISIIASPRLKQLLPVGRICAL